MWICAGRCIAHACASCGGSARVSTSAHVARTTVHGQHMLVGHVHVCGVALPPACRGYRSRMRPALSQEGGAMRVLGGAYSPIVVNISRSTIADCRAKVRVRQEGPLLAWALGTEESILQCNMRMGISLERHMPSRVVVRTSVTLGRWGGHVVLGVSGGAVSRRCHIGALLLCSQRGMGTPLAWPLRRRHRYC